MTQTMYEEDVFSPCTISMFDNAYGPSYAGVKLRFHSLRYFHQASQAYRTGPKGFTASGTHARQWNHCPWEPDDDGSPREPQAISRPREIIRPQRESKI